MLGLVFCYERSPKSAPLTTIDKICKRLDCLEYYLIHFIISLIDMEAVLYLPCLTHSCWCGVQTFINVQTLTLRVVETLVVCHFISSDDWLSVVFLELLGLNPRTYFEGEYFASIFSLMRDAPVTHIDLAMPAFEKARGGATTVLNLSFSSSVNVIIDKGIGQSL